MTPDDGLGLAALARLPGLAGLPGLRIPTGPARRRRGETARLRALARYAVLDTPPDAALDDVADLARVVTGHPVAGIGFLDQERIWFTSRLGVVPRQLRRDDWPTGRSVPAERTSGEAAGVRCHQEEFEVGGEVFRFLAAAPLVTTDGYRLGELFVMDQRPGELGPRERSALTALARQVMTALELRRTLLSYHAVVDGAGHVVFQLDGWCRLVSLTPTWSALTGYGMVRSLGRQLQDFVHREDRDTVALHLADMSAGTAPSTFECQLLRLAKEEIPVEVTARPLTDESGRRLGLVGVIADISERRARELEAQHAQRLEAFGRLAADLAVELDAPVRRLAGGAVVLADTCTAMAELVGDHRGTPATPDPDSRRAPALAPDPAPRSDPDPDRDPDPDPDPRPDPDRLLAGVPSAARAVLDGVDRVSTLVRAMRAFSPPGQDAQAPVDLVEALEAMATVARIRVRCQVEIAVDPPGLPPVTCAVGDLNHAVLDLVMTTAEAVEERGGPGTVTVSCGVDGENVVVVVSGTGILVSDGVHRRVADPFIAVAPSAGRTGPRLALVRAVVEDRHGGRVSVGTEMGRAVYTVTLPRDGGDGPGPRPPGATGEPAHGDPDAR